MVKTSPSNEEDMESISTIGKSPHALQPKKNKKQKEDFPGGPTVKNLPASARDTGSIHGPGRFHMPRSNSARVPQLLNLRSRAHEPQLLKPVHPRASLHSKRSLYSEEPALATAREKPRQQGRVSTDRNK